MKERLRGSIFSYLLVCACLLVLTAANAQYIQRAPKKEDKLPEFSYQTLDGKKFTNQDLKVNSRLMIVYFNPLCDVCKKETQEILGSIDYFKDIQIVMISPNGKEEIEGFVKQYNLAAHSQITVLHDAEDRFYKQFQALGYPSLYLYDHNKNLIVQFDSHTDISEIKEAFDPAISKK
ncbi:MAG: peroxiredoxin family protein [Cytophagaceae bacterium]|nr:peroxiredoxin family protein [Cytophagaceae bacterium]